MEEIKTFAIVFLAIFFISFIASFLLIPEEKGSINETNLSSNVTISIDYNQTALVTCLSDSDCNETQLCDPANRCIDIGCGQYQYILNRTCVDYKCLTNDTCKYDEACIQGICQKLSCPDFVRNHECTDIQCYDNSECKYDEVCENNKCVGFSCGECQYKSNHRCLDYQCCSDVECGPTGKCENNTCVIFQCASYQYVYLNRCKNYTCVKDADCDDKNSETVDKCLDPYTIKSRCIYSWKDVEFNSTSNTFRLYVNQIAKDRYQGTVIKLLEAWDNAARFNVSFRWKEALTQRVFEDNTFNMTVDNETMFVRVHNAIANHSSYFTVTYS